MKAHACADGNKRIAFILTMEFLALNGMTVEMDPHHLYAAILRVAASPAGDRDQVVQKLTTDLRATMVPLTTEG